MKKLDHFTGKILKWHFCMGCSCL